MVSAYHSGRRFEYRVREMLIKEGWIVDRSLMSRGPYDLKARKPGIMRFIQCKKSAKPSLSRKEKDGLAEAVEEMQSTGIRAIAEVAYIGRDKNDARKVPVIFKEVTP